MAQSRQRRNQRRTRQSRSRAPAAPTPTRRRNLRRVVIAFLILVGLAGIMTISAPDGDPGGAPVPAAERPVG